MKEKRGPLGIRNGTVTEAHRQKFLYKLLPKCFMMTVNGKSAIYGCGDTENYLSDRKEIINEYNNFQKLYL